VFIETPYRNVALWQAMLQSLKPATRVAVASALTLPTAQCRSALVSEWKKQAEPVTNDVPAVFALGQ
jgi:16S rRNA (cytidine1402-2'-O)-methyltransferase